MQINPKEYADKYIIKKEREDYVLKEYIGNNEEVIIIPEGVTKISQYAFDSDNCKTVRKIIFPQSLKRIPDCNFNFWKNLEEVEIPEGVASIAPEAFEGTGLREILLPSTIDKIGKDAFLYCNNLKKITLMHITISILNSLMNGSYSTGYRERELAFSLYFGHSEDIELSQFFRYYIEDDKYKYTISDWFILYGNYIVGYVGEETNLHTPDCAIGIAQEAFFNNKNIRSITLSNKIKTICESAFDGCTSLQEINLNDTLLEIGSFAFANTRIKTITIPHKVEYIGESIFEDCSSLNTVIVKEKLIGDNYRINKWNSNWRSHYYGSVDYEFIK